MDQLFIFSRMFEDAWEFPNSLHEFWELEEGIQPCVLLEMLWEYMVSGPLLWPNQYNHYQSPVHIVGYKSDSFFVTVEQRDCCRLSRFRPQFPWTKFLGAAKRSGVVVTGSWDSPTHTGIRNGVSKFKTMVLRLKRAPWDGNELLPLVEQLQILGSCSWFRGEWTKRLDRQVREASTVMQMLYWSVMVRGKLSVKAKLLNCSYALTFT